MNKKVFCVFEFAKTESIVTVQWRFRIMYHTEPHTDKTIREWYMNSSKVAACALRNEQAACERSGLVLQSWIQKPPVCSSDYISVLKYGLFSSAVNLHHNQCYAWFSVHLSQTLRFVIGWFDILLQSYLCLSLLECVSSHAEKNVCPSVSPPRAPAPKKQKRLNYKRNKER